MRQQDHGADKAPAQKCADLTQGLLAVPREELERKLKAHDSKKAKAKKSD